MKRIKSRLVHWLVGRLLPVYRTDEERIARLDRLRRSLMSEWESNLMWGTGNVMSGVPFTRIVGLVDAMNWVLVLQQPDAPDYAQKRLRECIDAYLRDLDWAKEVRNQGFGDNE